MVKSIHYTPEHLGMIDLNESYSGDETIHEAYQQMAGVFVETLVWVPSGEILGVLTGQEIVPGNLEVSALVSRRARRYPIAFTKHVDSRIRYYEEVLRLRRVQATIRSGFKFTQRFIETIGFELEGVMRRFGPEGDDYMLYARVKP